MGSVLNLLLISRALVVLMVSPLFSLWGAGRGKRDLGNEVVVKRDGCTQAIVEPLGTLSTDNGNGNGNGETEKGLGRRRGFGAYLEIVKRPQQDADDNVDRHSHQD